VHELRAQGIEVIACDMDVSLWDVRRANSIVRRVLDTPSKLFSYWPWKWLASAIDDSFQGCLNVQRTALLSQQKAVDVLIGSSWGGFSLFLNIAILKLRHLCASSCISCIVRERMT